MRVTDKCLLTGSLLAGVFLVVSIGSTVQAGVPHSALFKALGHDANSYSTRSYPNYQYQQAPVEQRSFSATPEATSDVPAPPVVSEEKSDHVVPPAPVVQQQRRSFSYEPQPAPQMRTYRRYRSSVPSYELPRAMRN